MRVHGLNSLDCTACETPFEVVAGALTLCGGGGGAQYLGPATLVLDSGSGNPDAPGGLIAGGIANSSFQGLYTAKVAIDSPHASAISQGGGCGTLGSISAPSAPTLGNSGFRVRYERYGQELWMEKFDRIKRRSPWCHR